MALPSQVSCVILDLELFPCRLSEMVVSEKVVLKRLMPPLVEALRCSEGLVTLALHTLEYWVDSLNPEFLEPAMLPVIGELMRALWTHLRPVQDSQFGAKVGPAALVTALLTSPVQACCAELSPAVLAAHVLGCLTVKRVCAHFFADRVPVLCRL